MKYIRKGNEFVNLDKCRSIYYSVTIRTYGKFRLYFEFEKGSSYFEYDDTEQLKRDVAKIEDLIEEENMVVL